MVKTSKEKTLKRKHQLKDEFGTLDFNKALEIYQRLSKTCMSKPKETKPKIEKPKPTYYLKANDQDPAQK